MMCGAGGPLDGFSSWTHIVDDGNGYLLFYNQGTGGGAVGRIASDGTFTTLWSGSGFDTGWTNLADNGNGYVLFYNRDTGQGAVWRFGVGFEWGPEPGFGTGSTHVVGLG